MRKIFPTLMLLVVAVLFVSCGSPKVENVSVRWNDNNLIVSFQYDGDKDASAEIIVSDADGVRVRKTVSLSSILDNNENKHAKLYVVSIPKKDVGYGFYDTGTVTVVVKQGDKQFEGMAKVSLPMKTPDEFSIVSAYVKDDAYVVRVRAETASGEDAVLGKSLKVYVGDMSGRQLFLGTFNVFKKQGGYQFTISASQMQKSYTKDVLIKAKLEDFDKSSSVYRKAIARFPVDKVDIVYDKNNSRTVKICPVVAGKHVPFDGNLSVVFKERGVEIYSHTLYVNYDDFHNGCFSYSIPDEVRYSPTGEADIIIFLSDKDYMATGKSRISGLEIIEVPDKIKVSYKKQDDGVNVEVCMYKGEKKVPYVGDIIVSLYDGKTQLDKYTETVRGESCITKIYRFKKIGPTTGGKATLYVSAKPMFGKSLKATTKISGFPPRIYKVGTYYVGSSFSKMKVVATNAKFFQTRNGNYYFAIYVTITNVGYSAAYVSQFTFDGIDSLGNIYDSTTVFDKYEFNSGTIYPGYSRSGWMVYRVPPGVDINRVKYVNIGFENTHGKWYTLFRIPIYDYMIPEDESDYAESDT